MLCVGGHVSPPYAGQDHSLLIANISVENVAKFKYLGTTVTNRSWGSSVNIVTRLRAGRPGFDSCHGQ
jgi:hypothetical protein